MSDGAFEQMSELAKLVERAKEFGRNVMQENLQLKQTLRQLERKQYDRRHPRTFRPISWTPRVASGKS